MKDELNQWVIAKLNSHNMSMRELGRRSGIDQSNISKILSGKQDASLDFYLKIAQVFDDVIDMLVTSGILSPVDEDQLSMSEIYQIVQKLTPDERKEVLEYALWRLNRTSASDNLDTDTTAKAGS